jgi:hypothetical protein
MLSISAAALEPGLSVGPEKGVMLLPLKGKSLPGLQAALRRVRWVRAQLPVAPGIELVVDGGLAPKCA